MITEVARFVEGLLTFLFSGSIGTRKSKSVEKRAQELSRSGNKLFDPSRYQTTDTWEYSVNTALSMMNDHHVDASPKLLRAVTFLNPSSVSEYLAQFDERETTLIRGYEVIVRTQKSDPRDVEYRKSRIRQVLDGKLK